MFCTYPNPADADPAAPPLADPATQICQPFPVQVPLFWSNPKEDPDSANPPAPGAASCADMTDTPCPYLLVRWKGETVAVFGVVDPDLLTNVGMLNTSWLNKRNGK